MAISQSILGMNARNFLYIRNFNKRKYKLIADDKLETKRRLLANKVATTGLLAEFKTLKEVRAFDWNSLPESFVLKPSHGYGGRGILVISQWNGETGRDTKNRLLNRDDLESEIFGALDGAHSLNNLPDTAFIEERVRVHSFFKKYTNKGVPDIRVIVCNKIPIMAMLRLPLKSPTVKPICT
ncbi:MAG: sugar-transfer associated ATP-grasp domain-containing protein [Candidatus Paceibacterota bacterium]